MYTVQVVIEGQAFSNGVLPVIVNNGRSNLNTALCQFDATVSIFRKVFEDTFTAAGRDIRTIGKGAKLQVQIKESSGTSFTTVFDGVVTDTSSTADTIRFVAVDAVLFKLSNAAPVDYSFTGTKAAASVIKELAELIGLTSNTFSGFFLADANFQGSGLAAQMNLVGDNVPGIMLFARTPKNRTTFSIDLDFRAIQNDVLTIIPNLFPDADLELTEADIDKNYNLVQQAQNVSNRITVQKTSGSSQGSVTVQDSSSISAVGVRQFTFETSLTEQVNRIQLADDLLRRNLARGWAITEITTSYDRIATQFTDEIDCYETLIPAAIVELVNVSEPYLPKYGFIQKVFHTFEQNQWTISLLIADLRVVWYSQLWLGVTSNLKWSDVNAFLTWDDLNTIDI
jgi:hypothetical protein